MANMTSGIADYFKDEQFHDEQLSNPEWIWKPEELTRCTP
jgi:hypothetical protein